MLKKPVGLMETLRNCWECQNNTLYTVEIFVDRKDFCLQSEIFCLPPLFQTLKYSSKG